MSYEVNWIKRKIRKKILTRNVLQEQTIMWQQGHYMGPDSGIHSGAGTQAPSLTGRYDLLLKGVHYIESNFYAVHCLKLVIGVRVCGV